ncbi:MAG: DUF3990 domain-containing protein [Bacilli bacterium]
MLLPASGIITLYHGTTLFFADVLRGNGVWLSVQRRSTDFGQGFYLTQDYSQAGKWACFRIAYGIPAPHPSFLYKLGITWEQYQRDKRTIQPVIMQYTLNVVELRSTAFGVEFPLPKETNWNGRQMEARALIHKCRRQNSHTYDYVYGPVADGNAYGMPEEIQFHRTFDQLSLNTEQVLDRLSKPIRVVRVKCPI